MDFLLRYPESPPVAGYPFFGSAVGDAAARFAAGFGPEVRTPGEAAAAGLRSLGATARGVLLPPGVVSLPPEPFGKLVRAASAPLALTNDRGQALAVGVSAPALAAALRDGFAGTLAALAPGPGETVVGHPRIEDAATWSAAVREAQRTTARRFLDAGALVEDPETLWADPTSRAEPGARIGPSVLLTGDTVIGAGAGIGSFVRLHDTRVAPGARVFDHSVVSGAAIGARARVGPFAKIRPGARLGPEAFVGSFVEAKNAVLGSRAAAPHLAYVGDADIGPGVNVGAGTITCNYDGRGKHRTVIGAGAFVGSNATLVAPVRIGRGAFVAAGSVITEDVPESALAIGRGRQVVKPGRGAGRFDGAEPGPGQGF